MADAEVRQRKPNGSVQEPPQTKSSTNKKSRSVEQEDAYSPWVDILRVLTFLFLVSCGASYVISGGDSWFWGMKNKPHYLKLDWWRAQLQGPLYLTPNELAAYDGSDASKPLYLSINGTIYDVSDGARMYGPGGSYHAFVGCDASRGFVTGCFQEDRTGDMRGVEEMFLPLDDPQTDAHFTAAQFEKMKVEELEAAQERVHSSLQHWVDFFGNSKKYTKVGYIKYNDGWPDNTPVRELCKTAQKQRKKRVLPEA